MLYKANGTLTQPQIQTLSVFLTNSNVFKMTDYQRDLKWRFDHVKETIDDFFKVGISEKGSWASNYGQIILHKSQEEEATYIIDGQQRTTRVTMVLLSFLDYLNSEKFLLKKEFFTIEKNEDNIQEIKNFIIRKDIGKVNLKNSTNIHQNINSLFVKKLFSLNETPENKKIFFDNLYKTDEMFINSKNSTINSFKEVTHNYFKIFNYIVNFFKSNLSNKDNNEQIKFLSQFYNNILYYCKENFQLSVQYFTSRKEAAKAFLEVNKNSIPLNVSENIIGFLYTIPFNLDQTQTTDVDFKIEKACSLIQEIETLNNNNPEDFFKVSTNVIHGKITEKDIYDKFTNLFITREEQKELYQQGMSEHEVKYNDLIFKSELNRFYIDTFNPNEAKYLKNPQSIKLLSLFNSNKGSQREFKNMIRAIIVAVLYKISKNDQFYNEKYLIDLLKLIAKLYVLNIFSEYNVFSNNASYDFLINFSNKIWKGELVSIDDILNKYKNDEKGRFKNLFDKNHILNQMKTKEFKMNREKSGVTFLLKFLTLINSKNTTLDSKLHLDHFVPQKYKPNDYINNQYLTNKIHNFINLHLINGIDNSKAQNNSNSLKFNEHYLNNKDLYSVQLLNELYLKYNKFITQVDYDLYENEYCNKILDLISL